MTDCDSPDALPNDVPCEGLTPLIPCDMFKLERENRCPEIPPSASLRCAASQLSTSTGTAPAAGIDGLALHRLDFAQAAAWDEQQAAMEFMLDKMKNTKSNDEFFSSMKR